VYLSFRKREGAGSFSLKKSLFHGGGAGGGGGGWGGCVGWGVGGGGGGGGGGVGGGGGGGGGRGVGARPDPQPREGRTSPFSFLRTSPVPWVLPFPFFYVGDTFPIRENNTLLRTRLS